MISDNHLVIAEALAVAAGGTVQSNNWIDINENRDAIVGEPLALVVSFENGTRPTTGAGSLTVNLHTSQDANTINLGKGTFNCYWGEADPTNQTRKAYPVRYVLPLPENGNFERYLTAEVINNSGAAVDVSIRLMPVSMAFNLMYFDNTHKIRQVI